MSHGPGRIDRTIRALFDAHPDLAFVTDELCEHCYPEVKAIERKHRVAVLRAAYKLINDDPDWTCWLSESQGGTCVWGNQANVRSRAMAHILAGCGVAYHSPKRARRALEAWGGSLTDVWEREDALAEVERQLAEPEDRKRYEAWVRWHVAERDGIRDGDARAVEAVRFEQAKDEALRIVNLRLMVHDQKHAKLVLEAIKLGMQDYVLPNEPQGSLDNRLEEIAALRSPPNY